MKLLTNWWMILPAVLIVGFGFARPAYAEEGAMRVATANPSKILAQMQETQDKNKAVKAEQNNLEAEAKQRASEIEGLQKDRDDPKFLQKHSPQWEDLNRKIVTKRVELQAWEELKKAELTRKHKEEIKALFDKIQATIGQVAQEKKIDLVITDFGTDIPEDLDTVSMEELHARISQKNVLYTAKGVDLSPEVVIRLDAAYKK